MPQSIAAVWGLEHWLEECVTGSGLTCEALPARFLATCRRSRCSPPLAWDRARRGRVRRSPGLPACPWRPGAHWPEHPSTAETATVRRVYAHGVIGLAVFGLGLLGLAVGGKLQRGWDLWSRRQRFICRCHSPSSSWAWPLLTRADATLEPVASSLSGRSLQTIAADLPDLSLGSSAAEVRRWSLLFVVVGVRRWCQPPQAVLTEYAPAALGGGRTDETTTGKHRERYARVRER